MCGPGIKTMRRMFLFKRSRNNIVLCVVCIMVVMYWMRNRDGFHCPTDTSCLCVQLQERLGNHLYIVAAAYSIAKSKGMKLYVSGDATKLTPAFKIQRVFESTVSCKNLHTVKEIGFGKLSPNIVNLPSHKSVHISGYFQNYQYFEKYRDDIKMIFSFREHILQAARNKLKMLLTERFSGISESELFSRTLVGVHIRRGDYLKTTFQESGYRVAPKEYLFRAQNYMRTHYPKVIFIICSEGVNWGKIIFSEQSDVIVAPLGPAAVDMALLTLMNHTIITVGTFGFWSAWLNPQNGTVIYYKDFVTYNSNYSKGFDPPYTNIFYPYWIGM